MQTSTARRPDPTHITNLASAFYGSAVLFAASDLGIFSEVSRRGAVRAEEVASALGLSERGVTFLMNACVALQLLEKDEATYRNTPDAEAFLASGGMGGLSGAIRYNRDVYPVWQKLPEFVRSGEPVERPEVHLGGSQDRTTTFVMSMHGRALAMGPAIVPRLQLNGCRRLLDVGGGPGTFSVLISRACPDAHCTVLDLPEVASIASGLIQQQHASERVTTLAGDYHMTPFPRENDAILFFGMLHQESPDSIRDLLKRAWDALEPGGTVHVLDMMTDETHAAPAFSALFAVNMALTSRHGWVFSSTELQTWVEEAGFTEFAVEELPPPIPHWLARARKPVTAS